LGVVAFVKKEAAMLENNSSLERQRTMYALVEAYEQSNQTHRDFCAAHNLALSTFGYWIYDKQLEKGTFTVPENAEISREELGLLLSGLEPSKLRKKQRYRHI
jgi:hypothetical protein